MRPVYGELQEDVPKLMPGAATHPIIQELKLTGNARNSVSPPILQQIVKLERRIFPKHESLSCTLELETSKRNCLLLYAVPPTPTQHQEVEDVAAARSDPSASCTVSGYVICSFTSSLAASIVKLAVRECCRRQGYGEALLRAAISRCQERSVCRVTLHVDPTREAAMNLYRKLGFQLDAVVEDYYAPRRNAHRMFIEFDKS